MTWEFLVLEDTDRCPCWRGGCRPDDGYAELIDWIAQHAPGPRLVVAIEGTRSYGVGLAQPGRPRSVAGTVVHWGSHDREEAATGIVEVGARPP